MFFHKYKQIVLDENKQAKKRKGLIIFLCIFAGVILIVVLALILFLYAKAKNLPNDNTPSDDPSAEVEDDTESINAYNRLLQFVNAEASNNSVWLAFTRFGLRRVFYACVDARH